MKDEINLQVSVGRQPTRRQLERQRIEVKMAQIRTRQAECMVQLLGSYAEQLSDQATEQLVLATAKNLLQIELPEQPMFSLQTVAAFLNASPDDIDRLTDEHGLRNTSYGRWVTFRSAYTGSNVASFRYYDHTVARLQHILASRMRHESRKDARALREAQVDRERLDWLARKIESEGFLSLAYDPRPELDGGLRTKPVAIQQPVAGGLRTVRLSTGETLRAAIDSARAEETQRGDV